MASPDTYQFVNMQAIVENHRGFFGDSYQMHIFRNSMDLPDGKIHVVTEITMKEVDRGIDRATLPAVNLSREGAVRLMDSLWQAGVRPSEPTLMGSDVRQSLMMVVAAKDAHIEDLRRIVNNRLALEIA